MSDEYAKSTALALRDEAVELDRCRNAIGDVEIYIYETWEGFHGKLTLDGARRLLAIADTFGWDMEWVAEMREWAA
jgi:hypothetical protein